MKNLYLIGAGGHCRSCIDVIEQTNEYRILGLFDNELSAGTEVSGYKVLGSDSDLKKYIGPESYFLITVGQIKSAQIRQKIAAVLADLGANIATVISPRAYVSATAVIGAGTIVMHDALINSAATVGNFCIINTKALVEHDAQVTDFCHVSTGAILNGNVRLESGCFVGSQAVVKEGLVVPPNSIIGAGTFYRRNDI